MQVSGAAHSRKPSGAQSPDPRCNIFPRVKFEARAVVSLAIVDNDRVQKLGRSKLQRTTMSIQPVRIESRAFPIAHRSRRDRVLSVVAVGSRHVRVVDQMGAVRRETKPDHRVVEKPMGVRVGGRERCDEVAVVGRRIRDREAT